jgi:hypothetical protein
MHDLESDDESVTRERIMCWYREIQVHVRNLQEDNEELCTEVAELRESAAHETSEMLGRAQVQHYKRDARTYHGINALVLNKIFPFKKFVVSQRDLEDFIGNSSLGMVMLKVKMPDR